MIDMNTLPRTIGAHVRKLAAPHGPRLTADERRADVIEAAVAAFGVGGLAGTSTEEIARLAGVSQPYLFRLFGTKQALFLAAVGRMFERVSVSFEDAARRPAPDAEGRNPVLASMGQAYGTLLADRSLLRLQLHAFAACDDPAVRGVVRRHFADLVERVAELSDVSSLELRTFFAEGMLLNVAAAMELTDLDAVWERICLGGPA
jgi:AcrR family transcriptional regulator